MKPRSILSAIILAAALAATAADHAPQSRLAQGRWVKIKVDKEGIYQIDPAQLAEWGFTDPAKVRVYGYGGTALALGRISAGTDDLRPTMSMLADDGRLLFYADADTRLDLRNFTAAETYSNETGTIWRHNIYDSHGCYFLSDIPAEAAPDELPAPATDDYGEGTGAYTGHMHVSATDTDLVAPLSKGAIYCEREFSENNPYTISIDMPGRVLSEAEGGSARQPVVVYSGYAKQGAADIDQRQMRHDVAGTAAEAVTRHTYAAPDRFSSDTYLAMNGSVTFSAGNGSLKGTLTVTPPEQGASYKYYMDRHATIYPRINRLPDGSAGMVMHYAYSVAGRAIVVDAATPSQHLWDISDPCDVRPLQLRQCADASGKALATMPQTFGRTNPGRLILFDAAGQHPQPEFAGEVAPQNLHGAPVPELAIITTAELEPYARRLAEAHERVDGISVGVFLNEQVLNEFSSGVLTPVAYRRFARMFYDRDPATFRHLLLLGPARWDHRGVVQASPLELLAVHECDVPQARAEGTTAYAFDGYAGCLDDFTYINGAAATMHINVGRIPASDAAAAAAMVDHIIDYIENPPSAAAYMRPLFTSGSGDAYEHYFFAEESAQLAEDADLGFVVKRLHRIAYPKDAGKTSDTHRMLCENLAEGRGLMLYVGHSANSNTIGTSSFYSRSLLPSMKYNEAPVALLASCENYAVDSYTSGLAAAMLQQRGGGAIGIVGAVRSVYSHLNRIFAMSFTKAYTQAGPGATVGDLYRVAHNATVTENQSAQTRYNTKCYNLCGDPAVRLSIPSAAVRLTAINGGKPGLEPVSGRATLSLSGYVEGAEGEADTSFNGEIDIVVHDTATDGSVQMVDNTTKDIPEITITNRNLTSAKATVAGGFWTVSLFVPEFSAGGREFSFSADAVDSSTGRAAHGYFHKLPTAAEPAPADGIDTSAPAITEIYIDTPSFADSDITGPDPVLHAVVEEPATGINLSQAPLAGASRILIDGVVQNGGIAGYVARSPGSGSVSLAIPLSGMTDGRHTAELEVSNNLGVMTSRSVTFTVCATDAAASLAVDERPARTAATLSLDHNLGSAAEATIIIDDCTGHTVRTLSGTGASWDLADSDGHPVADGIYTATALVRAGLRRAHADPVEIIVLRAPAQ